MDGGADGSVPDPRRNVPRTDAVLADPRLEAAAREHGRDRVKDAVREALQSVRDGQLAPAEAVDAALDTVRNAPATTLRPVLNATGVVVHTNLGRAPLSDDAVRALIAASGYADVEFDLVDGKRASRGRGLLAALRRAVPDAGDVLVVNNGAAALVLATTALAADREIVVSRGEMVEIGDGFRLPDLIASTGVRLREVGTTNRVTLSDYRDAVGPQTGAVLKVHPSNFRVEGFTASVPIAQLAGLPVPVIADLGSGLLTPEPLLPGEPDITSALRAGAAIALCSGDKLLGGPQAGLLFGRADLIARLRRHPLARALRIDKLTIAALASTIGHGLAPVRRYLSTDPEELQQRCREVAAAVGGEVVASTGAVGGGGAPGVGLPGYAVALPETFAARLRRGDPPVIGRIAGGRCLLDLRCVPPSDDAALVKAVLAARG
jgi:L-seryl-tRNA(Ser) seleniumtransferase